jgi:hypothetical protein
MYRSIYTGESTMGYAVKAAVAGMRAAIKQEGYDYGPPPTLTSPYAVSPTNQARLQTRQTLSSQLGRKPTKGEFQAAWRQAKQDAANPNRIYPVHYSGMNPDNRTDHWQVPVPTRSSPRPGDPWTWTPWGYGTSTYRGFPQGSSGTPAGTTWIEDGGYPWTMDNRHNRGAIIRDSEGDLDPSNKEDVQDAVSWDRWSNLGDDPAHLINPNASIRKLPVGTFWDPRQGRPWDLSPGAYLDPRKPEVYNPTLPPNKQMTQDQMDAIRRNYYTRHPLLVPMEGQPGYNVWKKQVLRGR